MNIIITGASRGIGKYLYKELSVLNRVIGFSSKDVDLSDSREVNILLESLREKNYEPDVLINCAGVASMNHSLLTPSHVTQRIFDINVVGTFNLTKEIAKMMNEGGRIINFSSVAAPLNLEGEAIYAASKAAVEKFTKVLAKELAFKEITVNCIGPCPIKTDLIKNVPLHKIKRILAQQAIKKFGTLNDVLNLVHFFIDKRSNMITGQTIYLGGI